MNNGTGRTAVGIYYNERFDSKENIMVRIGNDKASRNITTFKQSVMMTAMEIQPTCKVPLAFLKAITCGAVPWKMHFFMLIILFVINCCICKTVYVK